MTLLQFLDKRNIKVNNMQLIEQAFMHPSYANEHFNKQDNERLEFMGDAVLQIWVSQRLYFLKPILDEGKMTLLRAQLVCTEALASYTKELGLHQYLKLGLGEEKTGGREKTSILANAFEAFIGALYLDQGMTVIDCVLNEVLLPKISNKDALTFNVDYKTKLQEYVQSDARKTVTYEMIDTIGEGNNRSFKVKVVLDGLILGIGEGSSKKKAEQAAAKHAFEKLVR